MGVVGAALVVFCLVPAGLAFGWLIGRGDRPAAGPVAAADTAPAPPAAAPAPSVIAAPLLPVAAAPVPTGPPPQPAPAADGPLPADVLERLKAATVFVKVRTAQGVASGSGFVLRREGDDAYLVTNHHVVAGRPGGTDRKTVATCQVVFHSGRRTEFTLPATVLAADQGRDLAVLRVTGIGRRPSFPGALGADPGEPRETLPVFILGFPFGGMLATGGENPAVTIGKGTVSSLREDELGDTSIVQVDGDINPGNSGGPVVDRVGRLIGITVAKIKGTNIGLAIPTDHLARMLDGRLSALNLTEAPAGEAGKIDLRVRLEFIDPFNRIRSAGVIVAPAGEAGPLPRRGPGGYPAITGRRYPMTVADHAAAVSVALTGTGSRRYVVQPFYTRDDGDEIRTQPVTREVAFDGRPRPAPPPAKTVPRPKPAPPMPKLPGRARRDW
jgi:S1-C subfamily serine protease